MMVDIHAPSAVAERVRELCRQFKLPTLAAETVGRFGEAGHADALPTLVEVLEQEAEDRRIRPFAFACQLRKDPSATV